MREDVGRPDEPTGKNHVGCNLYIKGPVAWIVEYEDRGDGGLGKVDGLGIKGKARGQQPCS